MKMQLLLSSQIIFYCYLWIFSPYMGIWKVYIINFYDQMKWVIFQESNNFINGREMNGK